MNNEKKPVSEESRKALYDKMGKIVNDYPPILNQWIRIQKELDLKKDVHQTFHTLLSLNICSCYFTIEMASIIRSSFRANLLAEKRYNIKYINCVINEAYKHLYGFDDPNKQTQARSKLWNALKRIDDNQLQQDLCLLERSITRLGEDGIVDKKCRDISFHYDTNPMSVYNMLMGLSEEEEFLRVIRFIDVLNDILKFTETHFTKYLINSNVQQGHIWSLSDVDFFKKDKDRLLIAMESAIETYSKRLDTAAYRQGMPDRVRIIVKDVENPYLVDIEHVVELETAAMQMLYILIDIASALRAYLTSEHSMERPLALKQIVVIIYEGFNKIFGLNGEGTQKSFWIRLAVPIVVKIPDVQLHSEFQALTMGMEKLKSKIEKLHTQRQLFVHYDRGIIPVCDELHNLNPLLVFAHALNMVDFLPKIFKFFTSCIHKIEQKNTVEHEQRMQPTYDKIDNILNLLNKLPDSPQKQQVVTFLTKFKTGELADDIIKQYKEKHHI